MKVKDAMHKGVDWVSPDTPVNELAVSLVVMQLSLLSVCGLEQKINVA